MIPIAFFIVSFILYNPGTVHNDGSLEAVFPFLESSSLPMYQVYGTSRGLSFPFLFFELIIFRRSSERLHVDMGVGLRVVLVSGCAQSRSLLSAGSL